MLMDATRPGLDDTTVMDVDEVVPDNSAELTRHLPKPQTSNALSKLAQLDSESEQDDVPARKPRGGLLSRLQPQSEDDSSDTEEEDHDEPAYERVRQRLLPSEVVNVSSSEDEEDTEGAYERMKRKLLASTGPQAHQKGPAKEQKHAPTATAPASSEDEDDAPVQPNRTRRLQPRKRKSPSPSGSYARKSVSRHSSPGLFVTPDASPATKKSTRDVVSVDNDSDQSAKSLHKTDFRERVERIRAERLASQKHNQERHKATKSTHLSVEDESESNSDGENGRRLTQASKPTRKAGKKAMEAMVRDQQRIVRNMQLTHQAKTKKRYGTKDLFAKFGFNQVDERAETADLPSLDTSSVPASPDAQNNQDHDTPPTSPPSSEDAPSKDKLEIDIGNSAATAALNHATLPRPAKLDKGKGRAPEFQHLPQNPLIEQSRAAIVQRAHIEPTRPAAASVVELSDSDDDLEIVQEKSRFPVFDSLPGKKKTEAPSLLHLRHLANLTSPSKRGPKGRKSMNVVELQASLHQKARQQAQKERTEKVEELRMKGIHIETEEEREKRQMEIEDMVAVYEKAREEDLRLAKLERDEAKKNGETGDGLLSSDDSEDDDYVASGEENAAEDNMVDEGEEDVELELSGSEDEEMEDDEEEPDEEEEEEVNEPNGLVNDMASEDDEEESKDLEQGNHLEAGDLVEDDEAVVPARKPVARRARNVIIDDDDDEPESTSENNSSTQPGTQNEAMAAFGFGNAAPAFGLTQAFAGTMANLDSGSQNDYPEPEQDSLDFLRSLPDTQPSASFSQTADFLIPNSQAAAKQQDGSQAGNASQFDLGISQLIETSPAFSRTQLSDIPEPTQDAGFLLSRSPAGLIPPPSTIDTVMMPVVESPVMERKGKLRRARREEPVELSDVDEDDAASGSDVDVEERPVKPSKSKDIFSVMKKAAKKQQKVDDFNKKTSWAKDAVDEQADESEDEYAGLGGASDDESGDEADEELAKMIDTNEVKVDERKIAAFYAEKSKKDDEKNLNQLYKDLMSGNLRKRAGRDAFDMSDSEDEAEMRRRKRQREFQQMTRALVQDEKIGKIAQNAKKQAFFNTLIDHYDDPDYDFLNNPDDLAAAVSQSQPDNSNKEGTEEISVPDSQSPDAAATTVTDVNPLKRKATDSQEKENRPPPHLRRTAASDALTRKPMSLADVQNSVSELLEDSRIIVPDSQYSSDSDDELAIAQTRANQVRQPIVDRLTISRQSTFDESTTTSVSSATMAFHAPSAGAGQPGFRIPSLLRRATSNFSTVSERSSSGSNTPVEGAVRRGGTGKSNIHAQAREAERRAVVEKSDMKRKEAMRKKVGRARGKRSVLRDLTGGFE